MNDIDIFDIKIRAGYANYNALSFFVQDGTTSERKVPDTFLPPEIEYIKEKNSASETMTAHFLDLHPLCSDNKEKAKNYLHHLLLSAKGVNDSKKIIDQFRLQYKKEKCEEIGNISFVENDFVVPSSTAIKYDEELISQKGAILLELAQKLYPVPDFCVLTSKNYFSEEDEKEKHLADAIGNLEKMTGQHLGSGRDPLVFAMRSATSCYIPGFLPTYLNVGINDTVYNALKTKYGMVVAGKIYINNLQTLYKIIYPQQSANEICQPVNSYFSITDIERKITKLYEEIKRYRNDILTDLFLQVSFLAEKSREFFKKNQDVAYTLKKGEVSYPSIIFQKMVWTIRNDESYPGVLYSRHSRTGNGIQVESVRNMFGDDIMTGNIERTDTEFFDREEIKDVFPAIYHFISRLSLLEKSFESPVTIEFAAETHKSVHLFAILQLNASELTGRSILLSSVDLFSKGIISGERVIKLVQPYHLKQIFSERIDDKSFRELKFFCRGISVLPRSAVSAKIYFSLAKALEAKGRGEKVCLCKETFVPAETIVLHELDAIISLTPAAVHVVTSCLGYGVPAFINLHKYQVKLLESSLVNNDGHIISEGDWITLSSKHRMIFLGKTKFAPARFQKFLEGKKLDLLPKEEKVFINMKTAYDKYLEIIKSLDHTEVETLNDLIKIIRNDLRKNQEKAEILANNWLDANLELYVDQILKSELGTHRDQHMIYELFTIERKIIFFKKIISICTARKINGYGAGSFMLGRFICLQHPVAFWRTMEMKEIAFLLNEYILFEKYLHVLNVLGERNISRARKEILKEGISNVSLSHVEPKVFMTLKLVFNKWDQLEQEFGHEVDPETISMAELLGHPFGYFYDYDSEWSLNSLREICEKEKISLPDKTAV